MEEQDNSQDMIYFDSHTHLLDYKEQLPQCLSVAHAHRVYFISANTTSQTQYAPMLALAQNFPPPHQLPLLPKQFAKPVVIPSFGIHPCFTQLEKQNSEWLSYLQDTLKRDQLYAVGQVGLDFRTVTLETASRELQREFFIKQLELSFRMQRPVTVHCVRAYGDLLKILKSYKKGTSQLATALESPIIMHSYGGSVQITKALLKLSPKIYFSLSLKRSQELCSVIPLERLLVETDAPYQINIGLLVQEKVAVEGELQEGETSNRVEYVRANVSSLSKHYGIDKPAFARKLLENALKAFRLIV